MCGRLSQSNPIQEKLDLVPPPLVFSCARGLAMAHRHPCKLAEAQLRVDFAYDIAQFGARMEKVVNFSNLWQDVECLSGNSFSM